MGALERRWNIVGGDGLPVRRPLVVGFARAMERLRVEAERVLSMFLRKDQHTPGAQSSLDKNLKPEWPNHGL